MTNITTEIAALPTAASVSSADRILLQQGVQGTPNTQATVGQLVQGVLDEINTSTIVAGAVIITSGTATLDVGSITSLDVGTIDIAGGTGTLSALTVTGLVNAGTVTATTGAFTTLNAGTITGTITNLSATNGTIASITGTTMALSGTASAATLVGTIVNAGTVTADVGTITAASSGTLAVSGTATVNHLAGTTAAIADLTATDLAIGAAVNPKLAVLTAPEVDSLGRVVSFIRRAGRKIIAEAQINTLRVGTLLGAFAPSILTLATTTWNATTSKLSLFATVGMDSTGRAFYAVRKTGKFIFADAKISNLSLGRDPTTAMEAVTKQYADAISAGVSPKIGMQLPLEPSIDYDAPTDGTTDASTEVNACVTAAIAAGDRYVWIDNIYNVPSLSSDCRDVIFIGPGSLIGHTLPTNVIPSGAPGPPPPAPTFVASRDCPVLAASIAATSTGTIVQIGDSISTPDGAVTFVFADSLSAQVARAFYDANPGVTLSIYNRGSGGQTFTSWAGVHNGTGTVPAWLTNTGLAMLSYIESLAPHCVTIALGINDSSSFKYSDVTAILTEMATWTPAPDVVFITGFGADVSANEASATSQRLGALFEQGAIRSFAKAHNYGLIDTAAEDDVARFGFSQETLPLLQDAEMVGGTLVNTNYAIDLPWTMPHDVYGWGATFIIPGAGDGWGDLGEQLTFQIGSDLNANMAGCFFEIRRNVDDSVDWRITTTLTAEGADADLVFINWTTIAGFTSQLNGSLILTIQKRGSVLYAALGGGTAGTATTNNDTIILHNGPVPSGGGGYQPIIRCAAGAVAGVLLIQGGAVYFSEALSQRVEHAPEQLYMPDLIDREFSSDIEDPVRPWGGRGVHPGMLALRRIVSRVINANDFRG